MDQLGRKNSIIENCRGDSGDIDQNEFTWLVESQKAAAEMTALQAASAGTVRIEQFRDSVLNVVIKTAVSAVAGGGV